MAYDGGVAYSTGGRAQGGYIDDVEIDSMGVAMTNPGPATLIEAVTTGLVVNGPAITGTVTLPAGTDAIWSLGGHSGRLRNGRFSIPTGVTAAAGGRRRRAARTVAA